jgi:hypothetical protein
MRNPWLNLPSKAPFVLPEDESFIKLFNDRCHKSEEAIMLDQLPSPYIGDPNAPVVLLNLNPGYDNKESNSPLFAKIARSNFSHAFFDYPFYPLDPKLQGTPSGYDWWTKKLNPLMRAAGLDNLQTSKRLFCVEYFPYHSTRYGYTGKTPPSQKYGSRLVESALSRGASVIIMRGKKAWLEAVPSLADHAKQVFTLHSSQNVIFSENNFGKENFSALVKKLSF